MSGDRVLLCSAEELAPGEARRFEVQGFEICLVRCHDGFHAITDECSHEEYTLSDGEVDPELCEIECWRHGSLFSLVTGKPLTLPATMPVATFAVSVERNQVYVDLPERTDAAR